MSLSKRTKAVPQSMTGYGESSHQSENLYLHVIIKTVNSKYLDLDAQLPHTFARQENTWRNLFAEKLKRGKVFFTLTCEQQSPKIADILDQKLLKEYITFLKKIAQTLHIPTDPISATLTLPGVIRTEKITKPSQETLDIATRTVKEALDKCLASREKEGTLLQEKLQEYLATLRKKVKEMDTQIAERQKVLRTKLQERLAYHEITPQEWEQEVNLNKTSLEEEKVRLQAHLNFFDNTLAHNKSIGKKLSFIIQEITRELSTIGAKAQHSPLQHLTVDMKEIVEQMKEQVANLA